jgi:hypothetical protein
VARNAVGLHVPHLAADGLPLDRGGFPALRATDEGERLLVVGRKNPTAHRWSSMRIHKAQGTLKPSKASANDNGLGYCEPQDWCEADGFTFQAGGSTSAAGIRSVALITRISDCWIAIRSSTSMPSRSTTA